MTALPVRLAVTAGLIAYVVLRLDWTEAGNRLAASNYDLLAMSIAALAGSIALGAVRWFVLLRAFRVAVEPASAARAYAIGSFANTFLPTSIGGDAVRCYLVGRRSGSFVRAIASIAVDRGLGLLALVVVTWVIVGVAATGGAETDTLAGVTIVSIGGAALVAAAVAVAHRHRGRWSRRASDVAREAWRALREAPRINLVAGFLLSLALQCLFLVHAWLLARGLRLELSLGDLAVPLTIVTFLTLLPISINGLGIREAGLATLLEPLGIDGSDSSLYALLLATVLTLVTLPLGLALLYERHRRPDELPVRIRATIDVPR